METLKTPEVMKKTVILSIITLFLSTIVVFGQRSAADKAYGHYEYQAAIAQYKALLKKNPTDGEALFNLANAYRLNGETMESERWFAQAVQHHDNPMGMLYYAQMLLSNGKYRLASEWFSKYSLAATNSEDAKRAKAFADFAIKLDNEGIQPSDYQLQLVPFNTVKLDFSPTYRSETELVFASNRSERRRPKYEDPWTSDHFNDLYSVELKADGTYGNVVKLPKEINTKFHEGSAVFTKGGNVMYFTRNDYIKGRRGFDSNRNTRLAIYRSELVDGVWQKPVSLNINNSEFSNSHPTLSADGKMMIFASDRPGGYGLMDLYVTTWQDTAWSDPRNLGNHINTSGNEVFPFLGGDGFLYFSSNLHVGFGGLDVFRARNVNGVWRDPINLGTPINSPKDDFGITANALMSEGYFTSNRAGKASLDDIYHFTINRNFILAGTVVNCMTGQVIPEAEVILTYGGEKVAMALSDFAGKFQFQVPYGKIYVATATKDGYLTSDLCPGKTLVNTEEIKSNTTIEIALPVEEVPKAGKQPFLITGTVINADYGNPVPNATVKLLNKCTGEETSVKTLADGSYRFVLPDTCDYVLLVSKDRFLPTSFPFTTLDKKDNDPIQANLPIAFDHTLSRPLPGEEGFVFEEGETMPVVIQKGTVIELFNVYFDLDKYDIRPDAIPYLEDLVKLLNEHPDMKGEISAHTDSRASFEYNTTLSQNRANSVMQYLISRGINANRMTAKGYGETQLKNNCADNVPCTEAEHQRNRRVEFRVTDFTGTIQSKEPEFIRKKAGTSETSMIQPEAKPVMQSPTTITATTGTSFTVQVGAGTIPMSRFKDIPDVKRMKGKDGVVRYTSGTFATMEEAYRYQVRLQAMGFTDAWVAPLDENRKPELADQ